mgnify:CR=1 FL=1
MTIKGIAFPFQKGTQSFPRVRTDADVVADNIQRILETRRGERPMRPGTGAAIWDFIFENVGALLNARIDHEVRRAISEGEPRATVLHVAVSEELRSDGAKNITVLVTWVFNREMRQTAVTYTAPGSG